jgi:hypothetical protein
LQGYRFGRPVEIRPVPNKSSCTKSDMGPVWDLVEIGSRSLRVSEPNDLALVRGQEHHAMKYDSTKATRLAAEGSGIDSAIVVMSTRSHGSVRMLPQCASRSIVIGRVQHQEEGGGNVRSWRKASLGHDGFPGDSGRPIERLNQSRLTLSAARGRGGHRGVPRNRGRQRVDVVRTGRILNKTLPRARTQIWLARLWFRGCVLSASTCQGLGRNTMGRPWYVIVVQPASLF